jgi:hypothetical protein
MRNNITTDMKKRGSIKKEEEKYLKEQMKTLERINSVRDSRIFYHSLQESKGEFKLRVTICRKNIFRTHSVETLGKQ